MQFLLLDQTLFKLDPSILIKLLFFDKTLPLNKTTKKENTIIAPPISNTARTLRLHKFWSVSPNLEKTKKNMEKFLFQVQRYFFWRSSIFLFSFFKTKRNLRFLLFEGILTWSKAKNQKNSGLIFWGICSHLLTPSKNSFKTKKSQAFFFGFPKSKQKTRGKQKKNMFEPEIKPSPESLVFFGFLVLSRFRSRHFFWILLITLSEKSFSAEWNHSLKGQSSLRIQLFLF